nr:hypothetical protein [Tanacetum cinerariifolium]GEZ60799.1 hypothetical protein [Tanacetum cinerariifolium]
GVCWGRWRRRVVGSSGLWWNGQEKTWSGVAGNDDEGKDGDGDDDDNGDDGEEGDDDADDQEVERDDEKDDEEEGGDDEQEFDEEEFLHAEEEQRDEKIFDHIPKTPKDTDDEGNGEEDLSLNVGREEGHDEEEDKLYRDVNINQGRGIQTTQEVEDSHVTLTLVNPDAPSTLLQDLPNFGLLFGFDNQLKTLEANFSKFMQTNQFARTVSAILEIVHRYMDQQMNEAVQVAMQLQYERLFKEKVKVQVFKILPKIEQTVNDLLEAKVLTRSSNSSKTSYAVTADLSKMELKKILIEKMEGNKFIHRSNEQRNLYKALVKAYESDKIILDTYGDTITLKRRRDDDADKDEEPSAGPDRGESAASEEPMLTTFEMEELAYLEFRTSADDQPIVESSQHLEWFSQQHKPPTLNLDFSNILINQIKVDTLTPKLLAGPTYELLKGSCKSLVELEYQLEEVYKATTDQLDWVNLEGQQYPHNLLKPLPLIPNNRGRHVIPFDHFINNNLEYLCGGASSRKYTTTVTKTNAADYEHIKWIEDLVPRIMWIHEPISYNKHALWGVSYWRRKRQQFYGFAVNHESARDVYSKRRIIAFTELKIIEWHNCKYLDWITVRRDDDKLYKFKEGDFKRLRIQDIKDMLLLLVQGKLTNLTVKERFAFNVSLRMFTRSIVIQRRVEDLQLGVESYQKKLNLTKPDTYRSDLKHKEAYIAYSNPRGFIYQNKDKKNKLMRIDELHKFCDGTLIDVCTALDDRCKPYHFHHIQDHRKSKEEE